MSTDGRFGLVYAPKFVGWVYTLRGWEAARSADRRSDVEALVRHDYGDRFPTCILPMGEQPVVVPAREDECRFQQREAAR